MESDIQLYAYGQGQLNVSNFHFNEFIFIIKSNNLLSYFRLS